MTTANSLGKFKVRYRNKLRQFKTLTGECFPSQHGANHVLMILDPQTITPEELKTGESIDKPIYRTLLIKSCLMVNAQ